LCEILNEAGVPKGVCNMVFGKGDPVGKTIVEHPGVPMISFTGGTQTGELIQKQSLGHFKKLSLELGGKNATIVLKDVDLKKVIPSIIRSSFLNQGEICLCGEKILVQEDIFEEFCKVFSEATNALVVGDPMDEKTFMGPLISKDHLNKVSSFIELAKKENGKIIAGGEIPQFENEKLKKGFYLRPTVIKDLTNCSEIHQSEIFGPVVTINSFKYMHEGVKWANTSPFWIVSKCLDERSFKSAQDG
jgi:aminomuconate-semialdehyde/2-hydroxymuconate-6-semialdehyde dehydrogenase